MPPVFGFLELRSDIHKNAFDFIEGLMNSLHVRIFAMKLIQSDIKRTNMVSTMANINIIETLVFIDCNLVFIRIKMHL